MLSRANSQNLQFPATQARHQWIKETIFTMELLINCLNWFVLMLSISLSPSGVSAYIIIESTPLYTTR